MDADLSSEPPCRVISGSSEKLDLCVYAHPSGK